MRMAQEMIDAHDRVIDGTGNGHVGHGQKGRRTTVLDQQPRPRTRAASSAAAAEMNVDEYMRQRNEIQRREATLSFDFKATVQASLKERDANAIIQKLKADDQRDTYDAADARLGWGGQKHPRFPADHFLSNLDQIKKTKLFEVACAMPKGAHLHIHFNACLEPSVLLDYAKDMDRMFISSDISLAPPAEDEEDDGAKDDDALDRCKIQFSIIAPSKEKLGDIFSPEYDCPDSKNRLWYKYSQFLSEFPRLHGRDAQKWLESKVVFHEEEAHGYLQTVQGAWDKFNTRTQMMKGLFNYETAYRKYTKALLEDFVRDKIQYAEIRPNFMAANNLWTDDGTEQIDNEGIMKLIIDEYRKFQAGNDKYFGGMKIIYCTPRSLSNTLVKAALAECLKFKKMWPEWVAGFDLVGEESKGRPLKDFIPEFLEFKKNCGDIDIPFLFHCGETLDIGNDTDGNIVDALLLGSKRIGHGFSLARHPYIMEHMKKRGVCLEVCPISNEELGLTPRISGHAMYNLLANNVHCTLNSDNGTIFRSSLSHDFYQAMVGKTDMTLHGWRQLIEWSLEHSCMDKHERAAVTEEWKKLWDAFLDWIITTHGSDAADPKEEKLKASA
ncbi:adenosine/AMP deaminase [Colletotrichum asianum]